MNEIQAFTSDTQHAMRIDTESYDTPRVSGRDLHEKLEVQTRYNDWFPRMCEYGFVEGSDFNLLKIEQVQFEGNREVTRTIIDHLLSIPMAKELCMLQRTDKGRMFRKYFIAIEEIWNDPQAILARALQMANRKLEDVNRVIEQKDATIALMEPKAAFADAVTASDDCILVRDLAKLLKQNGLDIGGTRLYERLRNDGFLCSYGTSYNMPTQRSMDLGLFMVSEHAITTSGGTQLKHTTKVTAKGQQYFLRRYLSEVV